MSEVLMEGKSYTFDKEFFEILAIYNDLEKLQEKIEKFAMEIETNDVWKMQKQINTVKNTSYRVCEHLYSLGTDESRKEYRTMVNMEISAKKVALLLSNSNMIEENAFYFAHLTSEDLVNFQKYYGVVCTEEGHGSWRWFGVYRDGHRITDEDMYELGIREKSNTIVKQKADVT